MGMREVEGAAPASAGYDTIVDSTMRALVLGIVAALLLSAVPASAHPTPFSYLDVRVNRDAAEIDLVAHIIDVAHDLNIDPPERLLEPDVLNQRAGDIAALLGGRFHLRADATNLTVGNWSTPEPLAERQSIRMTSRVPLASTPGTITLDALMFPYDPMHQTFINFYEGDTLALQAILDRSKTSVEFFSGSRQGVVAVMRRFIPAGIEHILIGPDHLLFLVGLLLLGGTLRQLAVVVSAFTLAHSITLSLAALNVINPPARIIEPAIALSIVYVGADNLMVRDGRDMRAWIAFGFGFIHGFGFANVLREMDLPRTALGWSLFSFNVGVEIGQLIVVVAVASALAALRSRSEVVSRRLAWAGSIGVIVAGAFWFIQRVFFPGGLA
jgi:hydrogenase/urease accessory protein HupE